MEPQEPPESTESRFAAANEPERGSRTPAWQWVLLGCLVAVLAGVFVAGTVLVHQGEDGRVADFAESGGPPVLAGPTLDGGQASLSDSEGEPVLVVFWAHWCPHCRAEMPVLQRLYEDGKIDMLTVTTAIEPGTGPAGYRTPEEFVESVGLTAPALADPTGEHAESWRVEAFPTLYFVDSEGQVAEIMSGEVPAEDVLAAFARLG